MDDVVELENVENLCRLCLSKDEPTSPIFSVQESSLPLADKIQACLSIEILSSDKLSKLICISCMKTVNQWHTYKESCLRSQEKLQRWLAKQTHTAVALVTNIKTEPMDIEIYEDNLEVVEMSEVENDRRVPLAPLVENEKGPVLRGQRGRRSLNAAANSGKEKDIQSERIGQASEVKIELPEDDEADCNVDVECVAESELLINPMAIGANKNMEPDSTQKFNASRAVKKKGRRGPHTHFRGVKVYKQRCPYCQVYLHSKNSYAKHVERYHEKSSNNSSTMPKSSTTTRNGLSYSNKEAQAQQNSSTVQEEEEIEDVEEELVNLEKDAPLTQVQESIISQLKTFSCYACQQSFNDRRSTLNHIRQHMPDLRPYTCIACLTEFPDRAIYKLHCGASFECAMKIALVVPKHGIEKYFTCNMCLRPMPNRKELLSHLAKHSDKQYEQLTGIKSPPKLKPMQPKSSSSSNIAGPYRNGDPAHNHTCDFCGMIYRYKPNMIKHKDLCKRLPPEERTSYRCVNCGMTFLVFKKFQSHIATEHNKKDLICFECNAKFRFSNEFLIHHQKHRLANKAAETHSEKHWNKAPTLKYGCAVCPEEFSTKAELTEHRNSHLKVKIFSCTICRRMFGNSQALQEHMNDHGPTEIDPNVSAIDFLEQEGADDPNVSGWSVNSDPGGRSTECTTCGKVFANYPNLRRHIQSAHSRINERFDCFKCSKSFNNEEEWNQHEQSHKENLGHRCNYCKKKFETKESWDHHQREVHGINDESSSACDICGKQFNNETSLKIHRGHHFRRDSRLSIRNMPHPMDQVQVELNDEATVVPPLEPIGRRSSRKAFSNGSSPKASISGGGLQCQVCDDRFNDVHELRKHLWDVHCAKTKPEKSFTDELQCELCTNIFPDEKSLEEHMKWHKENPILSDGLPRPVDISCDVCGKFYSSTKALWKHKKLHKVTGTSNMKLHSVKKQQPIQYPCPVCRKVFGNETSMKKHKAAAHYARRSISVFSPTRKASTSNEEEDIKPKRPKLDFDIIRKAYHLGEPSSSLTPTNSNSNKKPVTCSICKKLLPSMSSLYKHRQNVHKHGHNKSLPVTMDEEVYDQKGVPCSGCDKIFSNLTNMKQHYTKVHGNGNKHYCTMDDCNEVFTSPSAKQAHEKMHMNILYNCTVCSKHMFARTAMVKHLITDHKSEYQPNLEKHLYRKTDLTSYVVKGAEGRVCPICKITYPNIKAMKIHYIKIHESNS